MCTTSLQAAQHLLLRNSPQALFTKDIVRSDVLKYMQL